MTQEALNIAGQCRATASSELAKNILVDEGNGLLTELLLDAARIIEALAQSEQDSTYIYASSLATAIWQKHYMKESPKFALLDTTEGVLTQIDNMACGLVREKPAQREQEPVAQPASEEDMKIYKAIAANYHKDLSTPPRRTEQNFCSRCGKRTKDSTGIHTCTPPQENT